MVCTNRLTKWFQIIFDHTNYDINRNSVLRRFANCFAKGFARKVSDSIKSASKSRNIKQVRRSNKMSKIQLFVKIDNGLNLLTVYQKYILDM